MTGATRHASSVVTGSGWQRVRPMVELAGGLQMDMSKDITGLSFRNSEKIRILQIAHSLAIARRDRSLDCRTVVGR